MFATICTSALLAVAGYLVYGAGSWEQGAILAVAPVSAAVAIAMLGSS